MKLFAILLVAAVASAQTLDECLQKDSISCVQKSLYRRAKDFFGQENVEIVRGVSLVKGEQRGAKSSNELIYDQEIESKATVAERQNVLENFVGEEVSNFVSGRSLQINFSPVIEGISNSARALTDSVPEEVKQAVDEVVEGRGKKKLLKSILPLLIAAKVKIGLLATLAYFGIALLAKKAILASLISIAISAFIGLKSLWASKGGHAEVTPYNGGWSSGGGGGGSAGWSSGGNAGGWSSGSGGWEDPHGSYSAQSQAYSGYHH